MTRLNLLKWATGLLASVALLTSATAQQVNIVCPQSGPAYPAPAGLVNAFLNPNPNGNVPYIFDATTDGVNDYVSVSCYGIGQWALLGQVVSPVAPTALGFDPGSFWCCPLCTGRSTMSTNQVTVIVVPHGLYVCYALELFNVHGVPQAATATRSHFTYPTP